MNSLLIFEADCNGHVFGTVALEESVATARVERMVLNGVLFGHALMWVREHNPDPRYEVEFHLVLDFGMPGNARSRFTDRLPLPQSARCSQMTH
jgi:hypothetical protein